MAESSREEIAKLEALYASNPAGRVFTHLADAYRKAGELERARGILEEGLAQHPGYASAHVVLGRVLMDLQEGSEAIDAFQKVLELDPHNMVALQSLAELTRASGRNEEALRYYQELRQHDPNSPEVEDAIAELTGAVARPSDAEAVETPQSEFAEASFPEGDDARVAEPNAEATSSHEDLAEPEAAFDWEQQPEAEDFQAPEPVAAETNDVAEDVELDWLVTGHDPERDLGDLTSREEAIDEPTFGFADEIGDIGSLSAAALEEEQAEPIPFAGFTLEAPPFDVAEPPPEEEQAGELLTETIAELYRSQGLYDRAADVYRSLLQERPGDSGLEEKLHEVEALDRGEVPQPELSVEMPDLPAWEPFLDEETEAAEFVTPEDAEADLSAEQAEAWLAGGAGTAESAPTPYAWAEQASEPPADGGRPISDYFSGILAWRPKGEAAVAQDTIAPSAAETVEVGSQAAEGPFLMLEESEAAAGEETIESAAVPVVPESSAEAPEAMPWERPVAESFGRPSIPQAGHDETAEAFDEWFGPPEDSPTPEPGAPAQPAAEGTLGEDDDDDDLEMFRSWLQSLKK
jgi:tetratricopeptide (TPR) repeat protein